MWIIYVNITIVVVVICCVFSWRVCGLLGRKEERKMRTHCQKTHTHTDRAHLTMPVGGRSKWYGMTGGTQLVFSWSAQKKNGTRERDVIIACYYSPFWYFGNSRSPRLCVSLVAQAERHILYNRSLLKIWRMAPISVTRCGGWLDCSRRRISSGRPTKAAK
jgi:hypothetical protein